ncbi:MAG: hypothetical protein ACFFCP_19470 [Promethearchaeota archaeon]
MEDSYKNWFQVRYQYDESETFEKAWELQRLVDLQILEWGISLPEDELWHVRYGCENNKSWFSIRVKPSTSQMSERKKQAMELGDKIPASPILDDKKWWTSDNTLPGKCKTLDEWLSMSRILYHLSKIVYDLIKMDVGREEYFLYHIVIHHLHNMLHIQDEFYPMPLEHGLSKRGLLMSGRLLTVNDTTVQWFPPKIP